MAPDKKVFRDKDVPQRKIKGVEELVKLMNESNAVIIVSIKNLPASQYQLIKKKLRGEATIKVVKKNIVHRAIEKIEKGTVKNFEKYFKEDTALIFSKLDTFELSAILSKNKSMSRAKIGQIVPEEVIIEPGPTELVPGPVISELGGLGIKFAIEDGKINIQEKKVILKAGDEVNEAAASIMGKLDMKPIPVGLEPLVAYDVKAEKIYEDIKIDSEETVEELKASVGKTLAFAIQLVYACKDTIGFILAKANSEQKALEGLMKEDKVAPEGVPENGTRTSKEVPSESAPTGVPSDIDSEGKGKDKPEEQVKDDKETDTSQEETKVEDKK